MSRYSAKDGHGTDVVAKGRLTGATDTDYFYFFCPKCGDRQIMRVMDYHLRMDGPGGQAYPAEKPKQIKDFVMTFTLYCPACKITDHVKIGNVGWQAAKLPLPNASSE